MGNKQVNNKNEKRKKRTKIKPILCRRVGGRKKASFEVITVPKEDLDCEKEQKKNICLNEAATERKGK